MCTCCIPLAVLALYSPLLQIPLWHLWRGTAAAATTTKNATISRCCCCFFFCHNVLLVDSTHECVSALVVRHSPPFIFGHIKWRQWHTEREIRWFMCMNIFSNIFFSSYSRSMRVYVCVFARVCNCNVNVLRLTTAPFVCAQIVHESWRKNASYQVYNQPNHSA